MLTNDANAPETKAGSSQRVYRGILRDLEEGRMVPGQRLAETELAALYGVGRNAVREAIQRLSGRGVIDLNPHRSPAIRLLGMDETLEVLEVAEAMTALATRSAAMHYRQDRHRELLRSALAMVIEADVHDEPGMFSRARRHFYRALLTIGGNRELQRLFPAISMHIIYAQYQSRQLRSIRLADYRSIVDAITREDPVAAEKAGHDHVQHVRQIIMATPRRS